MANSGYTKNIVDSADNVKSYFDAYYQRNIPVTANEIDTLVAYFLKRGWEETSALNTASLLLQQAKTDKIDLYKLIDTLKGVSDTQLSDICVRILNANRNRTSTLGYKIETAQNLLEVRNIKV